MTDQIKVISKETLIPIGVILIILSPILGAIIFGVNLSSQVQINKERIVSHESMDDARVNSLQSQVQTMQNNQTKMDAKLDYIVLTLDEIKKQIK